MWQPLRTDGLYGMLCDLLSARQIRIWQQDRKLLTT